jgi:iron complex transport system permease protein
MAALAGALAALAAVVALGRIGGQLRRETLVLAGIVISTFLSACISLFKALNEESVSAIVFWIMGSLQGRSWDHVLLILPYYLLGCSLMLAFSRELDFLSLGESQARQLGVATTQVRLALLGGAGLVTAAGVAVAGVIGFVGLVVPHMVRLLLGAEHRPLMIYSALLGGLLLVWSDVAARVILPGGAELPVGVITALLGGPFFCFLLRRQQAGHS